MTMKAWRAERLSQLGSSIFAEVSEWKRADQQQGLEIIDLSIGSPDLPPSESIKQSLSDAVLQDTSYRYMGTKEATAFLRKLLNG